MPVDQYGIWYSGRQEPEDLVTGRPRPTGGAPLAPAPGGNVAEPLAPGLAQPFQGYAGDLPSQPFEGIPVGLGGFGGTAPSRGDFGTGSRRGEGWADFPGSYTTGGGQAGGADKNKSGQGPGEGARGTGPISVGAGQDRAAANAALTQRNEMLRQLFARIFGSGQPVAPVPTPPDLFSYAQTAIEAGRGRQQQELANEAAATGAAGSRDLAYRQGVVGSQALEALGRLAPQYQAQQFNLATTQAQAEYQRQQAEFATMLRLIAALGGGSYI